MTPELIPHLPAEDYHADQVADGPTLSSSIIHTLLTKSPAHAREEHPGLNPAYERKSEDKFDLGSAVHSLFLEGVDKIHAVDSPDWRNKAAKDERLWAREEGKVPLLLDQAAAVYTLIEAINRQLDEHHADPRPFAKGAAEQTLVWEEQGVMCRARPDYLHASLAAVDDLKTSFTALPDRWQRGPMIDHGYDTQCAFYLRGLEATTGCRPTWRWTVVEPRPPFALSVFTPGPDVLQLADLKVDRALRIWRECLEKDDWPAYSREVEVLELPPWEEARFLEREAREEMAA